VRELSAFAHMISEGFCEVIARELYEISEGYMPH